MEEELCVSVPDIKSKIICLRAQFGRELAKTNAKKSGQSVNDNYKSSWVYWENMQFLRPVMQAGKSKDNFKEQTQTPRVVDPNFDDDVNIEFDGASSKTSSKPISSKKQLEERKQELLSTCIQVLKEPIPKPEAPKQCLFSMFVAEKLATFDRRTRMMAEKRICDILFDLEMSSQSISSPSSQFQTAPTNQGSLYSQFPEAQQNAPGQFMNMMRESVHYGGN